MALVGYQIVVFVLWLGCLLLRWLDAVLRNITAVIVLVATFGQAIGNFFCNGANSAPWPASWLFSLVCIAIRRIIKPLGNALVILTLGAIHGLIFGILLLFETVLVITLGLAWLLHWALERFAEYILCRQHKVNVHPKRMTIHFVVLSTDDNSRYITDQELDQYEIVTRQLVAQCRIIPTFTRTYLNHSSYSTRARGDLDALLFPHRYMWYMCHAKVFEPTVFFVDDFYRTYRLGETLPVFTLYAFVKKHSLSAAGTKFVVAAHELCHLCDIFQHTNLPNRIMRSDATDEAVSNVFSPQEQCFWHTSRFAVY